MTVGVFRGYRCVCMRAHERVGTVLGRTHWLNGNWEADALLATHQVPPREPCNRNHANRACKQAQLYLGMAVCAGVCMEGWSEQVA